MKRAIPIFLLALAVVIGWFVVMLRRPSALQVGNPRFSQTAPEMEDRDLPAVLRYRSGLQGYEQGASFGLVLLAADGVPQRVLNLTAIEPALGSQLQEFHTHGGFELAERLLDPENREKEKLARFEESIDPENLASIILPPVDLFQDDLLISSRLVIGVDLNYQDHDSEADLTGSLFLRQVVPTGAYNPLPLGPAWPPVEGSRRLVDYGVEIGFVVLDDLFLDDLPRDFEALRRVIAFFAANDVTDAMPIIMMGDAGLAEAKSRAGYLPVGPWLVHGRHLDLRSRDSGREAVDMWLQIFEAEPTFPGTWRQYGSSSQMLRGPLEILQGIRKVWSDAKQQSVAVESAITANEVDGRGVIPAGSLVLTGSPRGNAFEPPRGLDRLRLMALGRLSPRGARVAFAKHCIMHRREMGFLSVGDRVEARVQYLGRQIWTVVP